MIYYVWLPHMQKLQPMLEGIHTCRNFSKIRDWTWERALNISTLALHVEDGRVVDYSKSSPSIEIGHDDPFVGAPPSWSYRVGDL
jgi:hypothetical protein